MITQTIHLSLARLSHTVKLTAQDSCLTNLAIRPSIQFVLIFLLCRLCCRAQVLVTPGHAHHIAAALILQNIWNGEILLFSASTLRITTSVGSIEMVDLHAQCNTSFLACWLKNGNSWHHEGGISFCLDALHHYRQLSYHKVIPRKLEYIMIFFR